MNILFLDWPCFGRTHALEAWKSLGYHILLFSHKDYQSFRSESFLEAFSEAAAGVDIEFCFSFNYFPVFAEACFRNNHKYISIVYDNPYSMLYSYTLIYETNYVFLFDSRQYEELQGSGIQTVYYLPLPAAVYTGDGPLCYDVSFIGSLYDESHNLYDRLLKSKDAYLLGYLEGLIQSQLQISGYNFIEDLLTPEIIERLQQACPYSPVPGGVETLQYVYANYFINRKITQRERRLLLTAVAQRFGLELFTPDTAAILPNTHNHGPIDYNSGMPHVFHSSRINLNITLRSITSGIPLRCMDIMGAGGFLLTNFQPDLLLYFHPNEDFVFYENESDLLSKAEYYLSHEKERQDIAQNAQNKIRHNHTYPVRFRQILTLINDQIL